MRRSFLVCALSLMLAACEQPATVAPTVPSTPQPASKPEAGDVAWTTEHRRLDLPRCKEELDVPVVTRPEPLAKAVKAWTDERIQSLHELFGASDGGCKRPEGPVSVARVRGVLQVQFLLPVPADAKFYRSESRAFAVRSAQRLDHAIDPAKQDRFLAMAAPRYQAAFERNQRARKARGDDDCSAAGPQYAPHLDAFDVTPRGLTFDTFSSLPMWARACLPEEETIFTIEELGPFFSPEMAAALAPD